MASTMFLVLGSSLSQAGLAVKRFGGADHVTVFALRPLAPTVLPSDEGEEPYEIAEDEMAMGSFLDEEVRRFCDQLGVSFKIVDLPGDAGYETLLSLFLNELRAVQPRARGVMQRSLFLTETTLAVAAAALSACVLEGVPVVMPDFQVGQLVDLPIVKMRYDVHVTDAERRTLKAVSEASGAATLTAIATKLRVKPPTMSVRLKRMAGKGLVTIRRSPVRAREVLIDITPSGRMLMTTVEGGT